MALFHLIKLSSFYGLKYQMSKPSQIILQKPEGFSQLHTSQNLKDTKSGQN